MLMKNPPPSSLRDSCRFQLLLWLKPFKDLPSESVPRQCLRDLYLPLVSLNLEAVVQPLGRLRKLESSARSDLEMPPFDLLRSVIFRRLGVCNIETDSGLS